MSKARILFGNLLLRSCKIAFNYTKNNLCIIYLVNIVNNIKERGEMKRNLFIDLEDTVRNLMQRKLFKESVFTYDLVVNRNKI